MVDRFHRDQSIQLNSDKTGSNAETEKTLHVFAISLGVAWCATTPVTLCGRLATLKVTLLLLTFLSYE